jgi:flagellar hook-associated protein 2
MSTVSNTSTSTAGTAAQQVAQALSQAQAAQAAAAQSLIDGQNGDPTLDVTSLTTALVNAKIAGQQSAINAEQSSDKTQLSAFGTLSSALAALQTSIAGLANGTDLSQFTATASGTGITATTTAGAVAGNFQIGVTQVASAQALTSGAFGATTALGTGTMNISIGGQSMSLDIDSSNNTLSGIASAINASSSNPGVTATIVNGTDGAHLVLRSNSTGAANTINVSVNASTDNGLSSLAVTSTQGTGTTTGASSITSSGSTWTQSSVAQDAQFTVDGTAATSSSNSVTTAIQGVTLNLTAAAISTSTGAPQIQTLTIAPDTSNTTTDIQNFVNLYNTFAGLVSPTGANSLTGFNSSASAGAGGGPLSGNSTVTAIQNELASILASTVKSGGQGVSLASIGVTLNGDGTLTLNNTTLTNALTANPTAVSALFNSTNGIGEQLNTSLNAALNTTSGTITQRTTALNADLANVATSQTALNAYQAQLTSQYNAQFTALNTLMVSSNSNSQYLTQLFGGSNSAGALASANSG